MKKILYFLLLIIYFVFCDDSYSQTLQEYKDRRERLMEHLSSESIIMIRGSNEVIRNGDVYYPFRQSSNFYYFTGIKEPDCMLFLSPGKGIYIDLKQKYVNELIFVPKTDSQKELWDGPRPNIEEISKISQIEEVLPNSEMEVYMENLLSKVDTLFFDDSNISLFEPNTYEGKIIKRAKEKFYKFETASINNKIIKMREIKTQSEIMLIKKAVSITAEAHKNVMKAVKPGMYECELEAIIEYTFKKNGARENGFLPIVGSGPFSCFLHYNKNDRKINAGDVVVIDMGAEYDMYTADITRTIPVSGRFTKRQKEIYNIVLKAHNEAIKLIKPGIRKDEIHKKSVEIISNGLINLGLINEEKEYRRYYIHGTSHPIGLDVHDPALSDVLMPGMIITIEPGIYIQQENLGIRIEDDVLITENGYEILSDSVPYIIEKIEKFIRNR
jgi:Xaa-Pro aminopeptidase